VVSVFIQKCEHGGEFCPENTKPSNHHSVSGVLHEMEVVGGWMLRLQMQGWRGC
jgi:hypothetical protein